MKDTRNTGKNPQSLAERVHRMTKELHLPGFRQRMEETLEDATWQQMTSLEQIYDLLNAEIVRREANTAVKLRRHSNLPLDLINARFEELYESDNRRWDTRLMALVRDGQWMLRETPADLILSGACGVCSHMPFRYPRSSSCSPLTVLSLSSCDSLSNISQDCILSPS